MGTTLDLKIFRRKKKIQLQVRGEEGIQIKICSVRLKTYLNEKKQNLQFLWVKTHGFRTICSSFSDAFFDRSESLTKFAKKSRMHHMMTSI